MNAENEESGLHGFGPRSRSGVRRPTVTTARWIIGRLVRVAREAGCGFIRGPSGATLYFSISDLAGGDAAAAALRPGARLRFQAAGHGVPRALAVAAL